MSQQKTTHFGYKTIDHDEKVKRVGDVFSSVADSYDIMNDLMSMGVHRLWKRFTINTANIRPHHHILDIASGTGDLALKFAEKLNENGKLIMSDINPDMLAVGRKRMIDAGHFDQVEFVVANAENLPIEANSMDLITIAFGLRNVTDKDAALRSMYQTLKPGGKLMILEFSKPVLPVLNKLYDLYSFNVIPKLGEWIANDSDSYQYLVESIRMHPDQETLASMMEQAGFEQTQFYNLTGGVVALHIGYKF